MADAGRGLALDATGEVYYTLAFGDIGNPPIPSLADLFYLLYYIGAYAGLVLLVRARIRAIQREHLARRRDRRDDVRGDDRRAGV